MIEEGGISPIGSMFQGAEGNKGLAGGGGGFNHICQLDAPMGCCKGMLRKKCCETKASKKK